MAFSRTTAPFASARPASRRPTLRDYLSLMRQRRALRDLEPEQLQDLGISRHEAQAEAARPVWDVPAHWR